MKFLSNDIVAHLPEKTDVYDDWPASAAGSCAFAMSVNGGKADEIIGKADIAPARGRALFTRQMVFSSNEGNWEPYPNAVPSGRRSLPARAAAE